MAITNPAIKSPAAVRFESSIEVHQRLSKGVLFTHGAQFWGQVLSIVIRRRVRSPLNLVLHPAVHSCFEAAAVQPG